MKVEVPFGRPDIDYDLRGPEVNFFHNPFPSSITGIEGHYVENVCLKNIEIIYPGRSSKSMAYIPLSDLDRVPEEREGYPEFSMFGELPAYGLYARHVSGVSLKNITFTLRHDDYRPAFVFDDVKNLAAETFLIPDKSKRQLILKESEILKVEDEILPMVKKY